MLTKLDAVNQILDAIDEEPVSSLVSGLPEAETAERFLDRITKEVLVQGWHCNIDEKFTLTPDLNGNIVLPDSTLKVDTTYTDADVDVTTRRDPNDQILKLYDRENHTFVFDDPILVDITWDLDFEDLPPHIQMYIAAHAAVRYQASEMGSVALDALVKEAEQMAWATMQDVEAELADANVLLDNFSTYRISQRNAWRNI